MHLIRQEQARPARVESLLLAGLDSGNSIEITDDWWEQKRAQLVHNFQSLDQAIEIKSGGIGINISHSQDTAPCRFPTINRVIVTSGAIDYFGVGKRQCRVLCCFVE